MSQDLYFSFDVIHMYYEINLNVPFVARMTAIYCWLKVLTVSSMAGLCEVTKLKVTSSLALLLLSLETLEA